MKNTLLLASLFLSSISFTQTKKIFHKSHSGKSSTLFLDASNNFGPGMAPIRYSTPVSPIKLNYALTEKMEYPLVNLDTSNKTMRFFDLKDSLLGCDRNYTEYLSHGDIVYDVKTNNFYVYQGYLNREHGSKWVKSQLFLPITDSILVWENKKKIQTRNHFIRDGQNRRILMSYPVLNSDITGDLRLFVPEIDPQAQPIKVTKNIERNEKTNEIKEQKRVEELEEKSLEDLKKKEENNPPFLPTDFPESNSFLLRWITFIMLFFSLFIFIGVQRIVKEELSKS